MFKKIFTKKTDEAELIARCLKGNVQAQEAMYERFAAKMYGVCLRYTKNTHTAEDVMQEGFIKVFRNLAQFRGEGSFEGWVRRIFVNTAIEHYRKQVNMYPILEVNYLEEEPYSDEIIGHLSAEDLMNMINQLAPGYRTIFNLFVIEGYSHQEIADQLQISEGTSKSQLSRARYLLQQMILEQKISGSKEKYV
ncbi:MAG: RNA polymerase sigma factor [Chitinophagales bacterium]|nr:RNA polymerase sigma factor [Bacteroidota bacterium]MCB9044441.1 RNA polymerase sigma factor [Chitinophagales bacterium]